MLTIINFAEIFFTHLQNSACDGEEALDNGEMQPVQKQVSSLLPVLTNISISSWHYFSCPYLFFTFQWKFAEGIVKMNPFQGANRVRDLFLSAYLIIFNTQCL